MDYLEELENVVVKRHGCEAAFAGGVQVSESFTGKMPWFGNVIVFDLKGHPQARRCYAWGHRTSQGGWEMTTVLEVPPVDSPPAAVRAAVASGLR
ncbi:MAG TPA: hypothetical protein VG838_11845 [Opitutaceae bacterium]|nr:hypothetical protein [Opitutaceae bacterium]